MVKYVPKDVAAIPQPKKAHTPGRKSTIRVLYMMYTRAERLSSKKRVMTTASPGEGEYIKQKR